VTVPGTSVARRITRREALHVPEMMRVSRRSWRAGPSRATVLARDTLFLDSGRTLKCPAGTGEAR